jgi:hypothetical protein
MDHPPIAKMTYTEEAASLVPNSAARWRAVQNILANNNQRSNEQKDYAKEYTHRLRPRKKTPQHKSTQNQLKVLKFEDNLMKQHKK